jgi:hypothetical protein
MIFCGYYKWGKEGEAALEIIDRFTVMWYKKFRLATCKLANI